MDFRGWINGPHGEGSTLAATCGRPPNEPPPVLGQAAPKTGPPGPGHRSETGHRWETGHRVAVGHRPGPAPIVSGSPRLGNDLVFFEPLFPATGDLRAFFAGVFEPIGLPEPGDVDQVPQGKESEIELLVLEIIDQFPVSPLLQVLRAVPPQHAEKGVPRLVSPPPTEIATHGGRHIRAKR